MTRWIDRLEDGLAAAIAKLWALLRGRARANARGLVTARFAGMTLAVPLLLGLSIPLLSSELVVLNTYVVDYALPLDTSLRWWHGQVPHLDYQTPIGAAYWLFQGLGVELTGLDAKSPLVANFLAAGLLGLSGVVLAWRRLSGGLAGLFLFAVLLLVITPRSTGDLPGQMSFLGAYNKWALGALAILLMTFFLEPRRPWRRAGQLAEALVVGLLLLWLVYLKVTLAAVAVAGAVVALHYAPANRRLTACGLALAVAGVVIVGLATGINGPYLGDLRAASGSVSLLRGAKLLEDLFAGIPELLVLSLGLVGYWRRSEARRQARLDNVTIALGLTLAAYMAMNQIHDHAWPLSFAVLILLAQRALAEAGEGFMAPTIAAFVLVAYAVFADLSAVTVYVRSQAADTMVRYCDDPARPLCRIGVAAFDPWVQPRLAPFPTAQDAPPEAAETLAGMYHFCDSHEYCIWWQLNDQLYRRLGRHVEPGDRPLYLGFMNMLPYYYGLVPPRHVLAWMDVNRNLSFASHPDPQAMLSDVTLLVIPRLQRELGYYPDLETIYGEAIAAQFDEIERTEAWSIWRRR
jgi:hypothetical protein